MNTEMDGKKIAAVFWPDTETEKGRSLMNGHGCDDIHLSAAYHGDHDEFWIVQMKGGIEITRHNPRYVETIVWVKT